MFTEESTPYRFEGESMMKDFIIELIIPLKDCWAVKQKFLNNDNNICDPGAHQQCYVGGVYLQQ